MLAGDITYIATTDGWLFLAVLLDLYSRRVVGWAMSDRIDTELALSALRMVAATRELEPNWIHHTDRDVFDLPLEAMTPASFKKTLG